MKWILYFQKTSRCKFQSHRWYDWCQNNGIQDSFRYCFADDTDSWVFFDKAMNLEISKSGERFNLSGLFNREYSGILSTLEFSWLLIVEFKCLYFFIRKFVLIIKLHLLLFYPWFWWRTSSNFRHSIYSWTCSISCCIIDGLVVV